MTWRERTRKYTVAFNNQTLAMELFDTQICLKIAKDILEGKTYPRLPFLKDVQTIMDAGANIGATSIFFAMQYPQARIYALEPNPDAHTLLSRNVAAFPQVRTFAKGLYNRECNAQLHVSKIDPVTNSVGASVLNSQEVIPIRLCDGAAFVVENQIARIDVLKLDTEGCELPILLSLGTLLERIQALFIEFHDEDDRFGIDALLRRTHILFSGNISHPHRGELCYVRYDSFPSRAELNQLRIQRPNI